MSGVNVLAVLDEHIGHYAVLQQLARDEGNNHYADELEEHCGTLTQLRFARAAVAELIEAVSPFAVLADQLDATKDTEAADDEEWAKFRMVVKDYRRLRAALSRVRGAE